MRVGQRPAEKLCPHPLDMEGNKQRRVRFSFGLYKIHLYTMGRRCRRTTRDKAEIIQLEVPVEGSGGDTKEWTEEKREKKV